MLKNVMLTVVTVWISNEAIAQFSPVQSSEGSSSLIINAGTNINANFQDSKIDFSSYIGSKLEKWENVDIRYHASFKATDGISKIVEKRKISPTASVGLTTLIYLPQDSTVGDGLSWLYISAVHSRANYNLYNDAGTFSKLTLDESEQNSSVTIGYNATNQKSISYGFGIQTTFSGNNYADLDEIKIGTQRLVPNSTNDTIQAVILEEVEARGPLSKYKSSFTQVGAVADLLYWPKSLKSQLAVGLHIRGKYSEVKKPVYNSAIGFYITKAKVKAEEDPTAIVGGLILELKDVFGTSAKDKLLDRGVISLVVGYTFGLK
ncbi:MAG: hypothetical protein IM631_19320 [Cytophagales bacterium]|jgi:hypothetical protein|nr:hypothetical protein [Cytophagales bacterium]MCA6373525.1 hypothetical protein [Cytophagales bacterium]MCA6377359.1 hypothetical protein [Cytophagales bacterium]MCA6385376.1 hypothetical protein [Cytophagales bacterium]